MKNTDNNISTDNTMIDKKKIPPSGSMCTYIRLEVEELHLPDDLLRTSCTKGLLCLLMIHKICGTNMKGLSPNLLSYLASDSSYKISAAVSGANIIRLFDVQQSQLDQHVLSENLYCSEEDNGKYYDWEQAKILFATS